MPERNEVGAPLKASDLNPRSIVVIEPPGQNGMLFTMWVGAVDTETVTFAAHGIPGIGVWHVLNFVRDDGEIVDDQGRVVRVFAYLGEP